MQYHTHLNRFCWYVSLLVSIYARKIYLQLLTLQLRFQLIVESLSGGSILPLGVRKKSQQKYIYMYSYSVFATSSILILRRFIATCTCTCAVVCVCPAVAEPISNSSNSGVVLSVSLCNQGTLRRIFAWRATLLFGD